MVRLCSEHNFQVVGKHFANLISRRLEMVQRLFIFPRFSTMAVAFLVFLREIISSKYNSQTVKNIIVPNLLLLSTWFRKIVFIFPQKLKCATCFCFYLTILVTLASRKSPKIFDFLPKLKTLMSIFTFIRLGPPDKTLLFEKYIFQAFI